MKEGEAEKVNDDIVFEMELIKQDEISIDRILWLSQAVFEKLSAYLNKFKDLAILSPSPVWLGRGGVIFIT